MMCAVRAGQAQCGQDMDSSHDASNVVTCKRVCCRFVYVCVCGVCDKEEL